MSTADATPERAHARHRLDDLLQTPVRLSIVAALAPADRVEFGYLRDLVETSDSLLSKHVRVLEDAGYVRVTKGYVGRRPRTWLAATAAGREALARHVQALREIVEGA